MSKTTKTVHSSRTIMYAELSNVMEHAVAGDSYLESLSDNVINKKTRSGVNKTTGFLKTLYGFAPGDTPFTAFKHFWQGSEEHDKPLLTFVLAIHRDYLLNESIEVPCKALIGDKVPVERFEENIERNYPGRYTPNTRKSMAQNLASSWKQAGFIEGKVKNIRVQPPISYRVVAFAALLAYLQGHRGDFILSSRPIKALCLPEGQLREHLIEAARQGLLQYQFAGGITSISFTDLLSKLGIEDV